MSLNVSSLSFASVIFSLSAMFAALMASVSIVLIPALMAVSDRVVLSNAGSIARALSACCCSCCCLSSRMSFSCSYFLLISRRCPIVLSYSSFAWASSFVCSGVSSP